LLFLELFLLLILFVLAASQQLGVDSVSGGIDLYLNVPPSRRICRKDHSTPKLLRRVLRSHDTWQARRGLPFELVGELGKVWPLITRSLLALRVRVRRMVRRSSRPARKDALEVVVSPTLGASAANG